MTPVNGDNVQHLLVVGHKGCLVQFAPLLPPAAVEDAERVDVGHEGARLDEPLQIVAIIPVLVNAVD